MPTIQMNAFVITMAYVTPRINLSVANHATPGQTPGFGIGFYEPVVFGLRETNWIRRGHHDSNSRMPHQLFANMRLTANPAAERLIPISHPGVFMRLGSRNEEPLTLPDRLAAFDLTRAKTRYGGPYIVNTVTWHSSCEPVALITAEQELILVDASRTINTRWRCAGRTSRISGMTPS